MVDKLDNKQINKGEIAILVFGILMVCLPIFSEFHFRLVPDDTYYYYQVARNFATTGNLTFDGQSLASGYHPLWMAICTALYLIFGDSLPFCIPVVAVLSFVVYWGLSIHLVRAAELPRSVSFIALMLFAANPVIIGNSWNTGLESVILMPILVGFLLTIFNKATGKADSAYTASLLCALMFLARLDTILFSYPILIIVFWKEISKHKLAFLIPIATVLLFVAAHMIIFSYPTPASADAIRILTWNLYEKEYVKIFSTGYYLDFPYHLVQFLRLMAEVITTSIAIPGQLFGSTYASKMLAMVVVIPVMSLLLVNFIRSSETRKIKRTDPILIAFLAVWLFLSGAVYFGTIRLFWFRPWYYPPFAVLVIFSMVLFWYRFYRTTTLPKWALAICMTVFAISFGEHLGKAAYFPSIAMSSPEAAIHALEKVGNGVLASFNTGYYGWASGGRIVNLDGLVNQDAFFALKKKMLLNYLKDRGVEYILDIDEPEFIKNRILYHSNPPNSLSLEPIAEFGGDVPKWIPQDNRPSHRLLRVHYCSR